MAVAVEDRGEGAIMAEVIHTAERLRELQALPLERKILISQTRIIEWHQRWKGDVAISFSGGKDSTVLLHLVRQLYPEVKAVFVDTGLEYPEIKEFVKRQVNVEIVRPKLRFDEVIRRFGYPLIGKDVAGSIYLARNMHPRNPENLRRKRFLGDHSAIIKHGVFDHSKWLLMVQKMPFIIGDRCCHKLKKAPLAKTKNVYVGVLAEESKIRQQAWVRGGCNAFGSTKPRSWPLAFWTEQDILTYLVDNDIEIASVYGDIVSVDEDGCEYDAKNAICTGTHLKCSGCDRTGCVYCGFGLHLEKGKTRFQRLAETHPRLYEYAIGGGEWVDNPNYDPAAPEYDGKWKNWNPKQLWQPDKKGLGMGKVFDMVNEIYGKDFYRYE